MKDIILLGGFILLGVGLPLLIAFNIPIPEPPIDYCANYKKFYEQQCRICESKNGVFTSGGWGSPQCSLPTIILNK